MIATTRRGQNMEIKSVSPNMKKLELGKSSTFTDEDVKRSRGYWIRSRFPKRHMDEAKEVHDSGGDDSAWSATYNYLKGRLGGGSLFLLTGPRGTGKTQMATCLGRLYSLELACSRYMRVADLYMIIKATFNNEGSESQIIDELSGRVRWDSDNLPRLLVLDEMHDRGGSEWEDRVLNQIVDARYGAKLDTILITNDRGAALKDKIGPSIISRADETGGIIECSWDSFRSR